jgi:hypothetical protein
LKEGYKVKWKGGDEEEDNVSSCWMTFSKRKDTGI